MMPGAAALADLEDEEPLMPGGLNLVLMGPPLAGKSTQAQLLGDRYQLTVTTIDDLLMVSASAAKCSSAQLLNTANLLLLIERGATTPCSLPLLLCISSHCLEPAGTQALLLLLRPLELLGRLAPAPASLICSACDSCFHCRKQHSCQTPRLKPALLMSCLPRCWACRLGSRTRATSHHTPCCRSVLQPASSCA